MSNYDLSKMEEFSSELSKGNALQMLCRIAEDPGKKKTFYTDGNKANFYSIDVLIDKELVSVSRQGTGRFADLYLTEAGRSLYTGLWYAQWKGELVPAMEQADILVPFIFWSDRVYRMKELPESGWYSLTDTEDAMDCFPIHDVFVTPEGKMTFTIEETGGTGTVDVKGGMDLSDSATKDCLKRLIDTSMAVGKDEMTMMYGSLLKEE